MGAEGAGVDESTTLRRGAAVECSATVVLERRAGHRSTSPCFMHCQQCSGEEGSGNHPTHPTQSLHTKIARSVGDKGVMAGRGGGVSASTLSIAAVQRRRRWIVCLVWGELLGKQTSQRMTRRSWKWLGVLGSGMLIQRANRSRRHSVLEECLRCLHWGRWWFRSGGR